MLTETFRNQVKGIKNNPVIFIAIIVTSLIVLYAGYKHHTFIQSIGYLAAIYLCALCIDMYTLKKPVKGDFIVNKPKQETFYVLLCTALGIFFLWLRFQYFTDWNNVAVPVKLLLAFPMLLFIYPIALGVVMLIKYKQLKTLGFRMQGFVPALMVIAVMAITNRIAAPAALTWKGSIEEAGGLMNSIFAGFILAGLSEEFFRLIAQTRFGALLHNKGWGWFIATIIWAFMHAPKWYWESKDLAEVILASIVRIPLGLMWGYLTYRTKSILPSILVHGTNYWGLQNL